MEKHIVRWTYWLGVACVLLALALRIFTALTPGVAIFPPQGPAVSYTTFMRGAVLFLLTAIATSSYMSATSSKS